jgi:hypothetical protein
MLAKIDGVFMEACERVHKETGESKPIAVVYSGREAVEIVGFDAIAAGWKEMQKIKDFPVRIRNGQYGLYVTAGQ